MSSSNTGSSKTSKIPSRSGLIRPTPVRHIITAASTTSSSLVKPQNHVQRPAIPSLFATGSKLSALKSQPFKSATVRKSTALNKVQISAQSNALNGAFRNTIVTSSHQTQDQNIQQQQEQQQQQSLESSSNIQQPDTTSILNSVTGDVGEIRKLLEQLLTIVQSSHETQESLVEENERLKKELSELKDKMRMVKHTVAPKGDKIIHEEHGESNIRPYAKNSALSTRSSVYSTPMI